LQPYNHRNIFYVVHLKESFALGYLHDVLDDSLRYAEHRSNSDEPVINRDDVRLAVQSRIDFKLAPPPPREVNQQHLCADDRSLFQYDATLCHSILISNRDIAVDGVGNRKEPYADCGSPGDQDWPLSTPGPLLPD
jgi:hypothetical protein